MTVKYLPALDALRGVAVLGVITVHTAALTMSFSGPQTGASQALSYLFASGRMGVELFFILSGFLMGWLYSGEDFSPTKFFRSRFLRIWPLWAAFSILWFVIFAFQEGQFRWSALFLSLTFLLWVSPTDFDTFIGGAWSIQIEVMAYVLFAYLKRFRLNALISVAIAVNILGTLASFADLSGSGMFDSIRRLSLQTGLNFFVLGVIVAVAFVESRSRQESFSWSSLKALNLQWLFLWLVSFLVTPAIYGNPIEALGFVAFAVILISSTKANGKLRRSLAWLGRYSYFLFFAHFVGLYFLKQVAEAIVIDPVSATFLAILTPLVIGAFVLIMSPLAWLSMKYIEGPILKLKKSAKN